MGRHSASYIAAPQAPSTGPMVASAATYVGRVGALALAMGIGAAVAGGAGVAHADGTTDNGTGGGGSTQTSPDTAATKVGPADPSTDGPSGVETRRPKPFSVPKLLGLSEAATTGPQETADAGPDSLTGLISRIPNQIAAVFGNGRDIAANSPAHVKPAPEGSPKGSDLPGRRASVKERPPAADDAVTTLVRGATDHLSTALRGGVERLGVVPSPGVAPSPTADANRQQRPIVSAGAATVPQLTTGIAAPAPAAQPRVTPPPPNPVVQVVANVLTALGFSPSASAGGSPIAPIPFVLGALQLISREIERIFAYRPPSTTSFTTAESYANANPVFATGTLTPGDDVETAYGEIGKWMLEPNGEISDYGGQPYGGKTLLESVNVIIVDPTSTSKAEATQKLNAAMFWSGFPAQPIHTTGFQGTIDDVTYGQQPTIPLSGYSNNLFFFDNDHGRIFGPDPVETSTGYVWSGSFSTETLTIYNFLPGHAYVSSDMARTALAMRLILSGQATFVGMVPLDNAVNTASTTTGDHDGYAVVLKLK